MNENAKVWWASRTVWLLVAAVVFPLLARLLGRPADDAELRALVYDVCTNVLPLLCASLAIGARATTPGARLTMRREPPGASDEDALADELVSKGVGLDELGKRWGIGSEEGSAPAAITRVLRWKICNRCGEHVSEGGTCACEGSAQSPGLRQGLVPPAGGGEVRP